MPSSISSSNAMHVPAGLRLTASDRPGVAQPVPERDVPERPWSGIAFGALALALCLLGLWEWHWRAFGVQPGYRNSDGAWAEQRRRINSGEGNALVLIGSSRVLFDVQLPVWSSTQGEQQAALVINAQIQRAVLAVARLRARGVAMVFLRAPSIDELHAAEEAGLPRSKTWDELLKRSGVPGIHFADYPALQGFDQPEWSHLSGPAADEFTARLAPLVNEALAAQKASE